jgi:GNAT superfamily N-acetyltransferase
VERFDAVTDRLAAVERARAALIERGLARRASSSEEDAAYFLATEVTAVLEHRRGLVLEPSALTPAEVEAWREREPRALENLERQARPGALVLLDEGARIGTVCFDDFEGWGPYAQVSSLYVAPGRRSRGVAAGLLDGLQALLAPPYAGLSLTTYWTWPRAVGFYLRHGCVVRQWKHALAFLWRADDVRWDVRFEGEVATFAWTRAGSTPRTWSARRTGSFVEWVEPEDHDADWYDGTMTFAVVLASRGWPIARSAERLSHGWRWAERGYPEGLAVRIERWEAHDRERGFVVETPRLPGLPYRPWRELDDE